MADIGWSVSTAVVHRIEAHTAMRWPCSQALWHASLCMSSCISSVSTYPQVHAFIKHHWMREASRQRYLDFCQFMEDELQVTPQILRRLIKASSL